ncbi:hypothetical protein Lsha_2165 [Legionella shakespearei DSM 23087]|uniref:Helix-turn-helix domain protein n=2 Tax=Legionella shakespearei TaxID=45075 RepID=A0A0W0YMF5_9GAMM|nr:hypothetical protein Lsha_2165 [Legionella shakespearei DSM 23087]
MESTGIQTARMLLAGIKPIDTSIDEVFTMSMTKPSRVQLLNEFESAPNSTLFNQHTIAAVLNCSTQLLERNRWAGAGIPYIKIGRKVLYRKSEVMDFLQQQKIYYSTSDQGQTLVLTNN